MITLGTVLTATVPGFVSPRTVTGPVVRINDDRVSGEIRYGAYGTLPVRFPEVATTPELLHAERVEHYRAMGEDYTDAINWATADVEAMTRH